MQQLQTFAPVFPRSSPVKPFSSSSSASQFPRPRFSRPLLKRRAKSQNLNHSPSDLRKLTSRVVELKHRKQLRQIFEEIDQAKKLYGQLNIIVMNAVLEACVHCGDVDSGLRFIREMSAPDGCGVDSITFAIILKGLGEARRTDEAFQILEFLEQGRIMGGPKLSPALLYGLLNALIEAGDLRRANGLLARYRFLLQEGGPSILMYNLLIKGYTNTDCPLEAFLVHDEILRQGLKPDRLTYNTLLLACVKSEEIALAVRFFAKMKEEAERGKCSELFPDAVTYTTLLKGFGNANDLLSVQKIVVEMKSLPDLVIDRVAYTTMVDALLKCGSPRDALSVFGEMIKRAGENPQLRPKPHLYLAMMRAFADKGDFDMVKRLHVRMLPDTAGTISRTVQEEADELHMEAALNSGQVDTAKQILSDVVKTRKGMSWTRRGDLVVVRIESLSGFTTKTFSPLLLHQVSLDDPIEKHMVHFEEARPLQSSVELKKVVMRFFRDAVVPVKDDWGSCIGLVHREDCQQLDAPLSRMMRGPLPCVTTSTSMGRVIELLLEKRYEMIIVVRSNNIYDSSYNSNSKAVGVFTLDHLFEMAVPVSEVDEAFWRTST
ncbi:pentatricopeptide repeat-containing protein At5g10690 isoform X2 [Aristolochia californica]|uniref:pentatricopeptide repeat-containing protein At5g10690 isoform X2 n=1 Tax=Aristolochia californica TaxID=171875 RepID=UPI0035E20B89